MTIVCPTTCFPIIFNFTNLVSQVTLISPFNVYIKVFPRMSLMISDKWLMNGEKTDVISIAPKLVSKSLHISKPLTVVDTHTNFNQSLKYMSALSDSSLSTQQYVGTRKYSIMQKFLNVSSRSKLYCSLEITA